MIKIPATLEGLPAITATLAKGISVNVTLIFSLERYEQVIDAYIEGIAQADANGHDLKHIGSVASFFVSRVDTAVDKLLEANGSDEAKALEGQGPLWPTLAWLTSCSRTSSPTIRVGLLLKPRAPRSSVRCGPPPAPRTPPTPTASTSTSSLLRSSSTPCRRRPLNALADHGNGAPSIKGTYEESHAIMNKLADLGINIKDVTDKLEADGVAAFIKSWDTVLADVQAGIDRVNG